MTPRAAGVPVLVVEDDHEARKFYRSLLRQAGYTVIDVEDGLAALQALEAIRPAAVVLDLALPRLSGRDVYREMKSHPDTRTIPIIVVSGTDTSDLRDDDFACVLPKPLDAETFLSVVSHCTRQSAPPPQPI